MIYLAREYEVRALLAGRMKRVVVPKPVDPRAGELLVKEVWCRANVEYSDPPQDGRPISSGQWAYYLASDPGIEHEDGDNRSPWQSAARMPPKWIRIRRDIASVTAKRFYDLTKEDATGCGMGVITKDGTLYKHGIPDRDGLPGTDNTGWPWDEWTVDPRDALRRVLTERYKAVDWVWIINIDSVSS